MLVVIVALGRARAARPAPPGAARRPARGALTPCAGATRSPRRRRSTCARASGWASRVELRQRFNVAPGDDVVAVTTAREGAPRGELLRWGLVPFWAKDPAVGYKMINARAETVAEKPAFRDALQTPPLPDRRRRLLRVAARGRTAARKQPCHITRADGAPFAFAGPVGDLARRRTTRRCGPARSSRPRPTPAIADIHDRMPVILPDRAPRRRGWTTARRRRASRSCWPRCPPTLTARRAVGYAVSDARHDAPDCLDDAPAEDEDPSASMSLF